MSDLRAILQGDLPALLVGSLVLAVALFLVRVITACLLRYGNATPEEAGEAFTSLVLLVNAIVLLLVVSCWIGQGLLQLVGVR